MQLPIAQLADASVLFTLKKGSTMQTAKKGDTVLVAGDLRFGTYTDKDTGATRETRDVVADHVGASLRYQAVTVERSPKANGPAADTTATGPVAEPVSTTGAGFTR